MEYQINKKRSKTIIIGILTFVAIVSIIGYTYSFFAVEVKDAVTITGGAASPSVSLTVTKVAPVSPNSEKGLIPQLDSAIENAVIGTQGNCVDDNINAVCQVYKLTVKNVSSASTYINGKLELNAKNNPNLKWAEVSGLTNTTLKSGIHLHSDQIITTNELYEGGETKDYYIVLWISEIEAIQVDSGSFNGTVTFESVVITNPGLVTLTKLGVTPEEETLTTISTTSYQGTYNEVKSKTQAICAEMGSDDVDTCLSEYFSYGSFDEYYATLPQTDDTGVYEAEDDLGTSYYYRGNVTNNYVKFGKNKNGNDMYWRIIRINGDGSVRMIYDGTQAYENNVSSTDRQVGTSAFNYIVADDYSWEGGYADNAFVGYMNGTTDGLTFPNGTQISTSYAEAHANRTNSTIKTYIDNWYKENIVDTGYSDSVVNAIYCNNRKVTTNQGVIDIYNEIAAAEGMTFTNLGYGQDMTLYSFWDILDFDAYMNGVAAFTPTLKCPQENDRFTTSTKVGNVTGNGKLEYPVGLITTEEVILAGGHAAMNNSYYLYNGQYYWTASPYDFSGGWADVTVVRGDGLAGGSNSVYNTSYGVRPVISLSSTAITGGAGTRTNPYTVS